MSSDSQGFDAYEAVLADLRAKREQIDQAIAAIESVRGLGTVGPPSNPIPSGEGPGRFLGMTIPEAAKVLLQSRRQPLNNADIAAAFRAGGLALSSADPVNTVGSVLTRRFNTVGDIVRVSRGTWGLAEWYPNRTFKKKEKAPREEPALAAEPTRETVPETPAPEAPAPTEASPPPA